jgi:hypothetical protein
MHSLCNEAPPEVEQAGKEGEDKEEEEEDGTAL